MKTENEDEIRFREEFNEILRQTNSPFKPSYEDIIRFQSQATQLLVEIEYYAMPVQLQVNQVVDGGAVFSFTNGFTTQWAKTQDVTVLHIFPPRELLQRLHQLKEAEKKTAQREDVKEIQGVLDKPALTQKALDDIFNEWRLVTGDGDFLKPKKVKKPRKKKNEHKKSS